MRSMTSRRVWMGMVFVLCTSSSFAEEVDKAMSALKNGEWKRAVEIARTVKTDAPEFARALYVCGEAYLVLGDATSSEASFRAVVAKNANALPAWIGLGRALTRQERFEEAEETLQKALKLDAKDPLVLLALGETHLAMEKTKEAKFELGSAFEIDPKNPEVVRGWCQWLFAENENAKALKVAQDFSKSAAKHPMGPFLEGLAYERDAKDKKAIDAYEEALKRDPNFLDAHKNLAILCHTRNPMYSDEVRSKKSLEHYARYFELGGKDDELKATYLQFKSVYDEYIDPAKKK